ncbi:MAG TPA: sulfatase-like hydrolase/transferase [Burkholderiales bacterium]|nr:sulfatase-like hydrolase/transferase [Burkholderiales bacterium]
MDVVVWCVVPGLFLLQYAKHDPAHHAAVLPHFRVVLWMLLGVALLRLTLSLLPMRPAAARAAAAASAAALLAAMIAYYGLVLIGLQSWGRVASWDLILGYRGQLAAVADALAVSLPVAFGVAALAYLALFAGAWAYLRRFDWTPFLQQRASRPLVAVLLAGGLGVWALELYGFAIDPPTEQAEPISLTAFPLIATWNFQGHSVDKLALRRRDAAEDAARALYAPAAGSDLKNVVLIVVDALRPDHMGIYGYRRDTTPNLSRLDQAGLVRKGPPMRATCASSFCGLLAITASKFVHQVASRPITLQEALRLHGYRVHLMLGGDHTLFYGLKRAYGKVDSYFDGRSRSVIGYFNDDRRLLDHLAGFPDWDGRPAMLQFHLMSAHLLGRRDPALAKYVPAAPYAVALNRDRERTVNFYDNGVLQADAIIADILAMLQRKRYLDNTVVAITADHGESLGEHGLYQHANGVREEVLRVPFLLLSYGYRASGRLAPRVLASQVDVAPTLLAELGLPPPASWAGSALQQPASPEFLYFQERSEIGVYDLRHAGSLWKYWVDRRAGSEFVFNLTQDPGEVTNALDIAPPAALREWRRRVLERSGVGAREPYRAASSG